MANWTKPELEPVGLEAPSCQCGCQNGGGAGCGDGA